ncbi:hypothetical protein SLS55_009306 [Diplodia seriata]|uniref:DUF7730 domain-containing protein n=1 Tax=Diplodia seriata TaxID=420778 RepID=A0ABR3C2F7_9PEZI
MPRERGRVLQAGENDSTPASHLIATPWPSRIYTKEDLKPYKKFPVLYGERKFAREFPREKQTLSFTDDLPTELRLMIYEHLQVQAPGQFLELWSPVTWHSPGDDRDCIFDDRQRGKTPIQNTFWRYASLRKGLSLLRLCKKVHGELTEMFYAEQNFRFSNSNGILMLGAWMHTIKAQHFQHLRHITVQIPMRDRGGDRCITTLGKWNAFQQLAAKRGMRTLKFRHRHKDYVDGSYYYTKTVKRVFEKLKAMAGLQKLELLVPWNYLFLGDFSGGPRCAEGFLGQFEAGERVRHVVEDHCPDEGWWEQLAELKRSSKSAELKIALVIHHGLRDLTLDADMHAIQGQLRAARWLAAYAKINGYGFGHARWDGGTYHVGYDADPLLALPRDSGRDAMACEPPEVEFAAGSQIRRASSAQCTEFLYTDQQASWPWKQE